MAVQIFAFVYFSHAFSLSKSEWAILALISLALPPAGFSKGFWSKI